MTKDEYRKSEKCIGRLLYCDESGQLWYEELISSTSKKGKALLKAFPKGGTFSKKMSLKFIVKNGEDGFDLGL
jgi:hypothetical protein